MAINYITKTCPTCGREFKTTSKSQQVCQRTCRRKPDAPRIDPVIRFMRHVTKLDNGCWQWDTVTPTGYGGRFGAGGKGGKSYRPHRWSYEHLGPEIRAIPDGMTTDHLCHKPEECPGGNSCPHRRCVNPDHIEVVTTQVNTERGHGPERGRIASLKARTAITHCPQGHEYTPENTYWYRGCRHCLTCKRERKYPRKKH